MITEDSIAGPQAWVDAYHDSHSPFDVDSLPIKAGALQGAVAIEYPAGPGGHRFENLHVLYDGVNGQLPNLDLVNTFVHISKNQVGIGCVIQRMWRQWDDYQTRLERILRGMLNQGIGRATGPHSVFMSYHVDAITLQTVGDGWQDEMSLGRVIESGFRSINNLLEHLHQSFFFYILMETNRFVSIGTYLPSAMLISINFTITSIFLWWLSGRPRSTITPPVAKIGKPGKHQADDVELIEHKGMAAIVPKKALTTEERNLFQPLLVISGAHVFGLVPLYVFNSVSDQV